jgi:hypothetical protein
MRRKRCPTCWGSGTGKYYDIGEEAVPGSSGLRSGPCHMCDGEGFLSPLRQWFYEAGQHMAAKREQRGESIMHAAARMGITTAELSWLERGVMGQACSYKGFTMQERRAVHEVIGLALKEERKP